MSFDKAEMDREIKTTNYRYLLRQEIDGRRCSQELGPALAQPAPRGQAQRISIECNAFLQIVDVDANAQLQGHKAPPFLWAPSLIRRPQGFPSCVARAKRFL